MYDKFIILLKTVKGNYRALLELRRHGKYGKLYVSFMETIIYTGTKALKVFTKLKNGKLKIPKKFYKIAEKILHRRQVKEKIKDKTVYAEKSQISYYQALGIKTRIWFDWGENDEYVLLELFNY